MRIFTLILVGLCSQIQIARSQGDTIILKSPLKFKSYMDLVGNHNLDYAAERFEVNKSEAAIEMARVFPDPNLTIGVTRDREGQLDTGHGISSGLDATIDLFGKRRARIDLAKSEHELSKALLSDFFRILQGESAVVFLEALKQKQLFSVKLNSWQTMKRLSEADSVRLKLGSIMEIDALQSRLEAGSLYNELLQAETDLKNSCIRLSQMTGTLKEDTLWVPDGNLLFEKRTFVFSELASLARNNRADLISALYNKDVARKAFLLAKRERNIDLGLNVGVENGYLPSGNGPAATTFSAGIAIPLKFSNYYKGELKQAKFQISQTELLYEKADLQIRTEIAQAIQKYQALCKQVDNFDHGLLDHAQRVRKGKIYSYNRGETSLLEVLNAQRTYNDMQQQYYETLFYRAVALVELEMAAGIWDISF